LGLHTQRGQHLRDRQARGADSISNGRQEPALLVTVSPQPLDLGQQGGDATCSLGLMRVVLVQPHPLTVIGHQVQWGGHSDPTRTPRPTSSTTAVIAATYARESRRRRCCIYLS